MPAQVAEIAIDDAYRMARALVITAIIHPKVDRADAVKPVAPLPTVVGNSDNPALRRPACG